ncbi:OLC1v1024819C1 [Oldenlandia corymbosa var. corymbosa]|uniref:OLC1v1024819C1 n=1 Tax=Oldenlandia corymbosa var. corymbosa TaxID=529605 RepID=A0AAV1C3S0_OLDCO|nr:OLC1v1024819C1 [Oldenlandia corymbosa var. corymbosa]
MASSKKFVVGFVMVLLVVSLLHQTEVDAQHNNGHFNGLDHQTLTSIKAAQTNQFVDQNHDDDSNDQGDDDFNPEVSERQSELLPENTSGLIGFNIEGVRTSFEVISSTKMWRGEDHVRSPDEVSEVPDYGEWSNLVSVKFFIVGGGVVCDQQER